MDSRVLELVECPACRRPLASPGIVSAPPDSGRAVDGRVRCDCGAEYAIRDGVLHLATDDGADARHAPTVDDVVAAATVRRWGALLPPASRVLAAGPRVHSLAALLHRLGHSPVVVDGADSAPTVARAFDAVLLRQVTAAADPPAAVKRAAAALKPGGHWLSLESRASAAGADKRVPAWCLAADVVPAVGYAGFLPSALLSPPPSRLTELALSVTDRLLGRSILRTRAHASYVAGRLQPFPVARVGPPPLLLAAALLLIAVLSGVWRPDPSVAFLSPSYYMGGLSEMLELANAPARLGGALVGTQGGRIEESVLDDVGYLLGLQLASLFGVAISPPILAQWHAAGFVAGAVWFAWGVGRRYASIAAAALLLVLLLLVGSRLSALIYGQVSNQTVTSLFPPLVLGSLAAWAGQRGLYRVGPARPRLRAILWAAAAALPLGALAGLLDLTRHSHGLAVMFTLAIVAVFAVSGIRARVLVSCALIAGYVAAALVMPAAVKAHRDIRLGTWTGGSASYLERPPAHHVSYTLLAAVGRYPNSLGLYYEDRSVDVFITRTAADRPEGARAVVDAAPDLFATYVREHPLEYLGQLLAGPTELGPFVAYTTFMAPKRWEYGWPTIVPGIDVEPYDVARYGDRALQTFRARYLQLTVLQWAAYLGAIAALVAGLLALPFARDGRRLLLGGALVYLAMVAGPRALIPVQGMDFIIAFWCVALLCAVHIFLAGPPDPLEDSTRA